MNQVLPIDAVGNIIGGFMAFISANMASVLMVAAFILGLSIVMGFLDSAIETSSLNSRRKL